MLILHQNSELSGLPNAPDICGIPVLEPWIESVTRGAARVARGPSLQFREAGQECPDWGLVQNPGPWIWVQDSWFRVFNPNFHSSVEIRIRTQNHREFQYELILSPDYTLIFYGAGTHVCPRLHCDITVFEPILGTGITLTIKMKRTHVWSVFYYLIASTYFKGIQLQERLEAQLK